MQLVRAMGMVRFSAQHLVNGGYLYDDEKSDKNVGLANISTVFINTFRAICDAKDIV